MSQVTSYEIEILAKTIYGEARGEYRHKNGGLASLIAIGNVVMNRVHGKKWYGNDIRSVCLKPLQFSCWNGGDANRALLNHEQLQSHKLYQLCQDVAKNVAEGNWPDLTRSANHYHNYHITPKWALPQDQTIRLGKHVFYRLS